MIQRSSQKFQAYGLVQRILLHSLEISGYTYKNSKISYKLNAEVIHPSPFDLTWHRGARMLMFNSEREKFTDDESHSCFYVEHMENF